MNFPLSNSLITFKDEKGLINY